jgi:predicted RNA-binding protein with RPS1 domain
VRASEISSERVNRIEDVVKIGDPVKVKIAEVDRQGRVNLSIRAVSEENGNSYEERQRAERARFQDRSEGGGDRGGFRRGPGGGGGGGGFRPRSGPPRG